MAEEGYETPTPIQTQSIPAILAGNDVLGCAQTGTGKTGAFAMPILHRLADAPRRRTRGRRNGRGRRETIVSRPRALVLCPTRELATQIHESFCAYGRHLSLRHVVIFGGVKQFGQVRKLNAGADVIVATPGRLLDLIGQGHIDLSGIEVLVLDEADRMLDMGFIHDIRKVVERMPAQRQTLFFSATMPTEIRRLVKSLLHDPVNVQVAPVSSTAEAIEQSVYLVPRKSKATVLGQLLRDDSIGRTLVFTRTKHGADKLVKILRRTGVEASAIHGNKSQNARTRALDGFKSGRMPILIATDIASRGIDVDEITHVVNYDIPNCPETYVHRIGRTARAGASGHAVSLCDQEELGDLRAIERLIQQKLEVMKDELDHSAEAKPRRARSKPGPASGRGGRGGGGGGQATASRQRRRRSRSPRRRSAVA